MREIKSKDTPNPGVQIYWTLLQESEPEASTLTQKKRLKSGSPCVPTPCNIPPRPVQRNSIRTWEFWILIVPGDNAWVTTWP